jgi:hypothetical protein
LTKLFEIADEIEKLISRATDLETGEIEEPDILKLDKLQSDFNDKALSVAKYIMGERAEAKSIEEHAHKMLKRAALHNRRADRLAKYLDFHLAGQKLKDEYIEVGYRKSEFVDVFDAELLAPHLLVEQPSRPNKRLIKDKIKSGIAVAGAALLERKRMYIK